VSLERDSGVILRTRLLTETSLIVHWLTATHGRIATVAKGARRPHSPFRGKLDLFFQADFSFQRSRRSDLHTLREVVVTETHPVLRIHIAHLRLAAYGVKLVEIATETETAVPAYHGLLCDLLATLAHQLPTPHLLFAFELKVLAESGLQPDLASSPLSAGARRVAQTLADGPFEEVARLKPSPVQTREIDRFLGRFIAQNLERVPKGRAEAVACGAGETTSADSKERLETGATAGDSPIAGTDPLVIAPGEPPP
jgi:DNA repair protein RecO (recombination protein O)